MSLSMELLQVPTSTRNEVREELGIYQNTYRIPGDGLTVYMGHSVSLALLTVSDELLKTKRQGNSRGQSCDYSIERVVYSIDGWPEI